jgi:alpha(1,3/1,4) fucosyltransferase
MIYGNVYIDGHSNNSLFAEEDDVHRYNPTTTPRLLRQAFLDKGVEINTPDVNQGRKISFDLHIEGRQFVANDIPQYLIALENPNINKLNASPEYCGKFTGVFAWDKRLFNLPNIVQILIPHPLAHAPFPGFVERDIFSCLINANKAFKENLPSDLYLERINTIRWYEKNAPDKFELYGMGWDKATPAFNFVGRVKRSASRAGTRLFGHKPFPSYRGEVRDKAEVLRRSKFSYCYENSRDLSNYITEKILDSLVNGCVPVYWGADNVLDYIPEGCFIDRRKFKDTSAVHEFLLSISAEDYAKYQFNIARFLNSEIARKFSSEYFVSVVVGRVTQDLTGAGKA